MKQTILSEYEPLFSWLDKVNIDIDIDAFKRLLTSAIFDSNDGHLSQWLQAYDNLPRLSAECRYDLAHIQVGQSVLSESELAHLKTQLMQFHPWRKGPFQFWGLTVDTEWQSNMKWDRLQPALPNLAGLKILDVGSGNGYYAWRMAHEQPNMVIGIEPSLLFLFQWLCVRRYAGEDAPVYTMPWSLEAFPLTQLQFDLVLSMGVLYHRQSPFDHLKRLKSFIKPGGQLILETLVVDGDENTCLVPLNRYARMRNVWFLPSAKMLINWVQRVGMRQIKIVDICETSVEEQRKTEWMHFDSLTDFLDLESGLTAEGYQRPTRAILTATC